MSRLIILCILASILVGCGGDGPNVQAVVVVNPSITLASSHTQVSEDSGTTITLTATASKIADEQITVTLATTGTATDGADYSALNGQTITISAGATTGIKTFTITDDSTYEGSETVIVAISTVSGASATERGAQSVTTTITENESTPTVTLATSATSATSSDTITLTATVSQIADEQITVTLGTTGTAADYSALNGQTITIPAGATTGTATFTATSDAVNEGSETATISISSVSGADSSSGGTISVSITINEYFLNTGTQLTYNSSNATILAATNEFRSINFSGTSVQNPLEVINAHKAYGYGLTGLGKTIAILDSGFYTGHQELDNKTITTYGTVEAATGIELGDDHGLFVSSIAAGEDDGTGQQGVAPAASLHIADYSNLNGNTYYPTHWANATDNASSAVVQNNSWGVEYQINSLQSDITANGWTNAFGLAQKWNSSGFTANEASANSYITALNNFQDHGVIVYALSNTISSTDADFQAALPELFSQLDEAWITAVNVEITGSLGNETYRRESAPCGSSARYCLGADGFEVDGAAYSSEGNDFYWPGESGTSFVAPQISGAVALLAEAFPNHTPEQWTDRLLASADNSFFPHTATVTFENGVTHGYNDEFGHGIVDIYAALNPITSSSYTRTYTGGSTNDKTSYRLGTSRLLTSSSLGDAVYRGLVGEVGYTYDDLSGGFEYDMASHIDFSGNKTPSVNLSSELGNLSGALKNTANPSRREHFNRVIAKLPELDNIKGVLTVGASSLPVQSFFDSNLDSSVNLSDYQPPYLDSGEGGIGMGVTHKLTNSRFLVGATVPVVQDTGQTIGSRKSLIAAFEYGKPTDQSATLIGGLTKDKDSLLGSTGTNAFSLAGSSSNTNFIALKAQKKLNDNTSLTGIATLANTDMTNPSNSLVGSANNIKSSSMALIANVRALAGDEYLSLFISQPSRTNSGSMAIRLASLADFQRNISYTMKDVSLEPTGRQVDYGFSYRKDFFKDLRFSAKHMITIDQNHQRNSKTVHSSYAGVKYKNMKFGLATKPGESAIASEFSYLLSF